MFSGARIPTSTYVYDDPDHPDRPTRLVHSPPFVAEDRALLMGLEAYEASLCVCGHPRAVAWHSEMDGFYDDKSYVCHACSAKAGREVAYHSTVDTRDPAKGPLPLFELGVTTVDASPPPSSTS